MNFGSTVGVRCCVIFNSDVSELTLSAEAIITQNQPGANTLKRQNVKLENTCCTTRLINQYNKFNADSTLPKHHSTA